MEQVKYKRILIKLSGEALMGKSQSMFDKKTIDSVVEQIKQVLELDVKVGIVIGGGNIFRGVDGNELGLDRINSDSIGMLATVMNGIALKDFLANASIKSKIYSAIPIGNLVKGYNRESMLDNLDKGNLIIFVAGTGNPCFTTDSGAALRAIEMRANLLIKATKVNGVYDADPKLNLTATKYHKVSCSEVIKQNLKIMDVSAFELCREHQINIEVCNIFNSNCLKDSVLGNNQGTLIHI